MIAIVPLYSSYKYFFFMRFHILGLIGARDQMITDIITLPEHQVQALADFIHILKNEFGKWDLFTLRRLNTSRGDTIFLERIFQKNKIVYAS